MKEMNKKGAVTSTMSILFFIVTLLATGTYYRINTTTNIHILDTVNFSMEYVLVRNSKERFYSRISRDFEMDLGSEINPNTDFTSLINGQDKNEDLYAQLVIYSDDNYEHIDYGNTDSGKIITYRDITIETYLENHASNTEFDQNGIRKNKPEPLLVSKQEYRLHLSDYEDGVLRDK